MDRMDSLPSQPWKSFFCRFFPEKKSSLDFRTSHIWKTCGVRQVTEFRTRKGRLLLGGQVNTLSSLFFSAFLDYHQRNGNLSRPLKYNISLEVTCKKWKAFQALLFADVPHVLVMGSQAMAWKSTTIQVESFRPHFPRKSPFLVGEISHFREDTQLMSSWWWLEHVYFFVPHLGNVIIPIDELIFFRGVGIPPIRCWLLHQFPNSHCTKSAAGWYSLSKKSAAERNTCLTALLRTRAKNQGRKKTSIGHLTRTSRRDKGLEKEVDSGNDA